MLVLMVAVRMLIVLTLMVATLVLAHLDTLEMVPPAMVRSIVVKSGSYYLFFHTQISMNVMLILMVAMRMLTVLTLMVATLVPAHLDTLEMVPPAMVRSIVVKSGSYY